ncbi:MAG: stage V sporulation protein AD [Christensenellaceae bacterium]|jgi:stage V sporulation protein AD|nr:stage V sporulation protein AD [Christensenellaceae bacterium]
MPASTIQLKSRVLIGAVATLAGPKESQGPLKKHFNKALRDDLLGLTSYELAESKIHESAIRYLLNKTNYMPQDIDLCIAGDLTDELYATNFAMRTLEIPFVGSFGACATYGAAIALAARIIDASVFKQRIICSVSSHFSTAERQFRFPLELGTQRTPLAQWTVTGAGAMLINKTEGRIRIESVTFGRVVDWGVKDANNMGGAMAPAAMNTMIRHFKDTRRQPRYYDLIITGDLGHTGALLLKQLMYERSYDLDQTNYTDCGVLIFDRETQKVEQGGSGPACSALVFNAYVYKKLLEGSIGRVLLVTTGALISKTSCLQKQSIPAIAHAVSFERI